MMGMRQKLGGWGMSSEWIHTSWGEIATLEYGKALRDYQNVIGDYPVYGTNGPIGFHDTALCKTPGVVIGRKGAYRGVHYSPRPFFVIDTAFYLKPKTLIDMKWAYYALLTCDINGMDSGSAIPSTSRDEFYKLPAYVPPLAEQQQIAEFLARFDDRITLLRETNATLEAIAQALFKSWFVDFDPVRAKMEGRTPEGMDEATAALFPDGLETSELGEVPRGWRVAKFEDFVQRLPVGKKFDQKTAKAEGVVPILDQGKSGVIGFHDEDPGVRASLDEPVVVFANHTCYMRLITYDFSAIQNVLPFKGKGIDTVWAYYATKGRVKFSEYKGHWPDFTLEKAVVPSPCLGEAFRSIVDPMMRRARLNEVQSDSLARLRDTLLPRLISGQLRLPEAQAATEAALGGTLSV